MRFQALSVVIGSQCCPRSFVFHFIDEIHGSQCCSGFSVSFQFPSDVPSSEVLRDVPSSQ